MDEIALPRDVSGLLDWLEAAPAGTMLSAESVAERLRDLPTIARKTPDSAYMTAAEAAEYLNMSEKFVYGHKDELGGRQFGSAVRFSRRALERYARRAC